MKNNKDLLKTTVIKLFQESKQEEKTVSYESLKKISKDIDVRNALNKIERNVAGRELILKTKNSDITDEELKYVDSFFSNIKFNRIINFILKARIYGNYTFEIVYNNDYKLESLIPIANQYTKYDDKEKKWKIKIGRDEVEMTHEKFLLCIHKWRPGKVEGESILEECNECFLDKELFRDQLRGIAKKYGENIIIFAHDIDMKEDEVKEYAESLKNSSGKTAIGVPVENHNGDTDLSKTMHIIKLSDLEPQIYTELEDREKTKLIQNILGSTLTMDVGRTGTQSLGTVHMEAEEQVVEECCSFICDSLQNLIKTISELHGFDCNDFYFSLEKKKDESKEIDLEIKKEEVKTSKINNIAILKNNGFQLTKDFISEYLGIDKKYILEIDEFESKKKTLNDLKKYNREKKNNFLNKAENNFLKKFSTSIKNQISEWVKDIFIKPLDLNFEEFYKHAFLVQTFSYLDSSSVDEFEEEEDIFSLKFDEAIKFALNKKPELFENIDIAFEEVRANAFWIKRSMDLSATEKVMKDIQKSLENGTTYKEWLKDIDDVVSRVGMDDNGWYSANVYRTNMLSFYNAGAYKQQIENADDGKYALYDGVSDNRQSKICKELDGKIFKMNDPIWDKIYPPAHYQCRSSVIQLSEEDIEAYGLKLSEVTDSIKNIDLGTFEGNPGGNYWRNLEKQVKKKEKSLEKKIPAFVKTIDKGYRVDPNKIDKDTKNKEFENLINNEYLSTTTETQQEIANFIMNNFDVGFKRITDPTRSCMASYKNNGEVIKCIVETSKNAKHVFSHEFGHAVDVAAQAKFGDFKEEFKKSISDFYKKYKFSNNNFSDVLKFKINSISEESRAHFKKYLERVNSFKKNETSLKNIVLELKSTKKDNFEYSKLLNEYKTLSEEREKIIKNYIMSNEMDHQLSDIIDMLLPASQGSEFVILGHANRHNLAEAEVFAELFCLEAASTTNINAVQKLEIIEALFPEVYSGYKISMKRLLKKVGGL